MKTKNIFITIIFLLFASSIFAQKPKVILPGQNLNVTSKNDTLWIINNKLFKKTIIKAKQLKICRQEVKLQNSIIDSLKKINSENKILVDTLKNDRNFYQKNWKKAEDDLSLLADMNKNQSRYTRIAIIVGTTTTVAAFIAGFLLGMK
jgi:hypothetical protein